MHTTCLSPCLYVRTQEIPVVFNSTSSPCFDSATFPCGQAKEGEGCTGEAAYELDIHLGAAGEREAHTGFLLTN